MFHNANLFGSVLFTFYIQGVLKLKKNNSGAKGLIFKYLDSNLEDKRFGVRKLLKPLWIECSASTCKPDTTKHHPQQTPTHNEKRTR